ncbi:MAG: hypothetical protein O7F76_14110 [Planctomycetota bacterium]|nr:hypothetical protein [Planctomycetota bacterium]
MGVLQAAFELRDSGKLETHESAWLEKELDWLEVHLESPACLREPGTHRAISWFHPRAKRAIEKTRSIVALLEEHGVRVRMVTTDDPGTIVYEDAWQIVAYPRRRKRSGG